MGGYGLTCVFVPNLVIPGRINALAVKPDILGADHKKVATVYLKKNTDLLTGIKNCISYCVILQVIY